LTEFPEKEQQGPYWTNFWRSCIIQGQAW